MSLKTRNTILLFITAFIWGTAFVAQSVGLDYLGPLTFNGVRTLLGGLVLLPCIWLLDRLKPEQERRPLLPLHDKTLVRGGVLCGLVLCVAGNLQQAGLLTVSAGKCGFITAFYIILVPIFGLFLHRRCAGLTWLGAVLALIGLYLLCIHGESFSVGVGELMVFGCAIVFAIHILLIDHFSPLVDGVRMSCIQFLVAGSLSLLLALPLEAFTLRDLLMSWRPLLYSGVLSCAVAYTLQVVGQKGVDPAVASLILSLESVFSVLAGWAVLHEQLSPRELLGCLLMFCAIMLVQVVPELLEGRSKGVNT